MSIKREIRQTEIKRKRKEEKDIALEPKVKNNPHLEAEIERIEKGIFEEIKEIIDKFEKERREKTKFKIISALKSKG
ncbi:MAG: hypothetical protein ACP5QK_02320 [Myxococcota bacterium]